jgi:hypothetical protein
VGILTQPDPGRSDPEAPAHVILDSGILHRVGASRLYVQIARALAEDGITTLRFDFSGIGDSEARRDSLAVEERFAVETREAMDYVQDVCGAQRFLVGGLCSGADGAFWAALRDERIVGVWQIDAFCYKTFGYYRRRYGPKLASPAAWLHAVKVRLGKRAPGGSGSEEVFVAPEYRRVFPPRATVRDGLQTLLDRGVQLFFFFTGGMEEYNYAEQHADAFRDIRLGSRARIVFEGACSHTVTGLDHQRRVVRELREWARAVRRTPSAVAAA